MTREQRERKRAKENLYYARVTAYTFFVLSMTFIIWEDAQSEDTTASEERS